MTDVVMHAMSGRELAESLVARYRAIRVLYTSGYPDDAVTRRDIRDLRVAFLRKPYDTAALLQKIVEVLGAERSPALRFA